jgi:cytochrome bd-type quinol oxidase subunit 1
MFSKGQVIFAILFFITFVIAISFAYRSEKQKNKVFFKGSFKVLVFILLVFFSLYGFVKLKHLLH